MELDLTPEEIEAAKKRTRRYRKAGQHAQRSRKQLEVARGTLGKLLKHRIS